MKKVMLFTSILVIAIVGGCKQRPATPGDLKLISVTPKTFSNDHDEVLTIHGEGITKDTSFFIQSNKLDVQRATAKEAKVVVPSGFLPATYGLMATRPDGQRSVLYPAITITKGEEAQTNPRDHPRSFVDGVVVDYESKQPIQGARVTAVGLHAVTDPSGYFLLWGVPPGRIPVRIEAEGYEPVYRYAEVEWVAPQISWTHIWS